MGETERDKRRSESIEERRTREVVRCQQPGQPNDDGTHTVIFKKKGSPAQQVDIATDHVLLAADVLRGLIDLGQDPDTGEHLYLADIEW